MKFCAPAVKYKLSAASVIFGITAIFDGPRCIKTIAGNISKSTKVLYSLYLLSLALLMLFPYAHHKLTGLKEDVIDVPLAP